MQTNTRKLHPEKLRPNTVSVISAAAGPSKQVRKCHARKVPYRVGYSWNKGGRLKELRIRHLARKFLKIWIQRTFGRVLPHKAKFHYNTVVLKRAFEGWRDEWWTSRREWTLIMRAECHYRYYLCNLVFQQWRIFVSLQREEKCKLQKAQLIADRQRMRQVWNCWEVFTDMKRIKKKMLESALELNKLTTLHSTWRLWQVRLQQRHEFYTLEDQAVKHRQLTLKHKSWRLWTEMHRAALDQKVKESKASLHFTFSLKRKTLHQWKCCVSCIQTKKASQAVALRAYHLHLLMMCWSEWKSALHRKQSEEDQLQAAEHLAVESTKRRAVHRWKAYVALCREKTEKAKIASQHYHHHLLHVGFHGFSLNATMKQTQRLKNNMAIQQYYQTLTTKYWQLWQDRIEQAEDRSYKQLTEMALTKHSTSLLSSCFQHWREKRAKQRHMQVMEHRADICFAERILPRCFNSWVRFTQQRKLNKQRKHKAFVFNQQRQFTWVFYTWWGRSEQHKEQMLSERMAILHDERSCLQRSWSHWRQRTKQRIIEEEKLEASEHLYKHRLLHKTMAEWRDNSMEIRDRRNREQQACHQGDVCCMRWAVDKWKKYVHSQRVKKSRLQQMQYYHEVKLLKHTFEAWKKRTLQMSQLCGHAEELHRQQKENFCRKVLFVWRENAVLMAEARLMEQRAQSHFEHVLQFKVFLSWRETTQHAVLRRHQQRETVNRAQRSLDEVRLLRFLRHWRKQTRAARRERICMEKARKHHKSKLLSKAMKAWKEHHYQCCKNKVMKRQGILLLRLKMYQTYFEQWRVKLQHRRREAQQTERALWHWSLSLQAKVLCGWRLWVSEQHRKQEQVVQAAQVYRDQLLREGVTCILTYAAHMNDLTKNLTQQSQEQKSRRLHKVVRRCALRWKQRALNKPQRTQEVKTQLPKKSVTFSLTETKSVSSSDSGEQEAEDAELSQLLLSRTHRRQPHRCEELFESPVKTNSWMYSVSTGAALKPSPLNPKEAGRTVLFNIPSANISVTSTHQSATISNLPTSTTQVNQDVLLPPSAFMTFGTEDTCGGVPLTPPKQQSAVHPDKPQEAARGESLEEAVMDSTSTLTGELLSIQLDMKTYQQDRKQLRAWQKLRGVLQSWLQTSGKEEQMERTAVCEELKELEERIHRLSAELGKRKPTMLLHAERIQHLQTVLHASGAFLLFRKAEDELCLLHDAPTLQE